MKWFFRPFYLTWVILSFLLSFVLLFPVFWVLSLRNDVSARRRSWWIVRSWSGAWLKMIGMPLEISGPKTEEGPVIFIANHQSYLDALLIFAAIPIYFRPLGKREVSKIPLFGRIYRLLTIMVDRQAAESRSQSMRSLRLALKEGSSVMIFPEGGFEDSEEILSPFYNGAFRLALREEVPIQPLLFLDARRRWSSKGGWSLWPGQNRVLFLNRISTETYQPDQVEALKQACFHTMHQAIRQAMDKRHAEGPARN